MSKRTSNIYGSTHSTNPYDDHTDDSRAVREIVDVALTGKGNRLNPQDNIGLVPVDPEIRDYVFNNTSNSGHPDKAKTHESERHRF